MTIIGLTETKTDNWDVIHIPGYKTFLKTDENYQTPGLEELWLRLKIVLLNILKL